MVGMVRSAVVFIVISLEYHLDNMLDKINDELERGEDNVVEKEGLLGGGDGRDDLRVMMMMTMTMIMMMMMMMTMTMMLIMMMIRRRGRTISLRRKGWWVVEMAEIT